MTICSWIAIYSSGIAQIAAAFGSVVGAIILGFMLYFQITNRKEKKIIKDVLNAFVNSWETLLKSQPQNPNRFSYIGVIPVLKRVANIRVIIVSKPNLLSNPHLEEALGIADEAISIIEQLKSPLDSKYGERSASRDDIDVLAKRARQCAAKLEGGNRTK